eukprot:7207047-Prorocentrum_lima.AAC.1
MDRMAKGRKGTSRGQHKPSTRQCLRAYGLRKEHINSLTLPGGIAKLEEDNTNAAMACPARHYEQFPRAH